MGDAEQKGNKIVANRQNSSSELQNWEIISGHKHRQFEIIRGFPQDGNIVQKMTFVGSKKKINIIGDISKFLVSVAIKRRFKYIGQYFDLKSLEKYFIHVRLITYLFKK